MRPKVESLRFENFRAFRDLDISGFGRVNLITGRNNVGKSSVLEGLRILAHDASPDIIAEILRSREEDLEGGYEDQGYADVDEMFQASALFHGFPQLAVMSDDIKIVTSGLGRQTALTMRLGWFAHERVEDGGRRLIEQQPDLFGEPLGFAALVTELNGRRRILRQEHFTRPYRFASREVRGETSNGVFRPCVYAGPYGGERTDALEDMWDNIALSDYQSYVLKSLQIIDPRISALAMVGSDGAGPRRPNARIAMVRSTNIRRRVPLRSYGDGINRLFSIILSLVNARGGLLLIDEFENGLHWTIHLDAWRTVFRHAEELDIQVFATTHSWDVIEAFQKASAESEETGVLLRLLRRDERILPTVFAEDELAVVTRDKIEVR